MRRSPSSMLQLLFLGSLLSLVFLGMASENFKAELLKFGSPRSAAASQGGRRQQLKIAIDIITQGGPHVSSSHSQTSAATSSDDHQVLFGQTLPLATVL